MKISVLTDGITPFVVGGMQRHSANMVRTLTGLGVEIDLYHVLPSDVSKGEVAREFTQCQWSNINAFDFEWPKCGKFPGHYVRESRELSKSYLDLFRQRPKPDVIYAKGLLATAFLRSRKIDKTLNVPIVTNVHGYEMYQCAADFWESLKRWVLRPAIRYVSIESDYVASYGGGITEILMTQLGVDRSRILEVPGAIDESWLAAPLPAHCLKSKDLNQSVRFGFLGRYERRKGIEELATVFSSLNQKNFELHIIGAIPIEKRNHFPQGTVFHGQHTDTERICNLLDRIDVLVAPSWSEGMPNVIMEAMARHTAVIATDVGAVRCLVGPDTGWLIPAGDLGALRKAVIAASEASSDAITLLKMNSYRKIATHFTWRVVGAKLHEELFKVAHVFKSSAT